MKAVIQRVSEANVKVDGAIVGAIANGLLLLIGIDEEDEPTDADWLVQKILNLRIFGDGDGKLNLSVLDISGEILCISQFTLIADYKKGNRPSFIKAAKPDKAIPLFEYFKTEIAKSKLKIESGIFGADMKVSLLNDGPVTIVMDSKTKLEFLIKFGENSIIKMKQAILIISALSILSCSKKEIENTDITSPENKKIESLNIERQKLNENIAIKNQQNVLKDLSGKHQLKFTSDEAAGFSGTVNFENTGRDLYEISGNAKSGKNTLAINGTIKKVTEKHLNFDGEITQKINGTVYKRTSKTTFFNEGKGNFWRLQNKINSSGFVDYIDIYF